MTNHAYALLDVRAVAIEGAAPVSLLRLRNPWGRGEWSGPWSDGSSEWTEELQTLLAYDFADDGASVHARSYTCYLQIQAPTASTTPPLHTSAKPPPRLRRRSRTL